MRGLRKVLVAVNGNLDVLKEGINLAKDEKTWVTVVKVVPEYDGDLNLTGIKNIHDVLDSGGNEAVAGMRSEAEAERALIKTRLETGDIHTRILEVAREERCDIIVMGPSRKKGFIHRLLGGNILEKVIRYASCPVLVVGA
jgi:nucleotide-binding universal stress UspA family protein